jgi:hypothetical protein
MKCLVVVDRRSFQILCFGVVAGWCCGDSGTNSGRFVRDVHIANVIRLLFLFVSRWRFGVKVGVVGVGNGHMDWRLVFRGEGGLNVETNTPPS